jgi:hypothetical protein
VSRKGDADHYYIVVRGVRAVISVGSGSSRPTVLMPIAYLTRCPTDSLFVVLLSFPSGLSHTTSSTSIISVSPSQSPHRLLNLGRYIARVLAKSFHTCTSCSHVNGSSILQNLAQSNKQQSVISDLSTPQSNSALVHRTMPSTIQIIL